MCPISTPSPATYCSFSALGQDADDPDRGDRSPSPTKNVEIPGPPVVLATQDGGSTNGNGAPDSQEAGGGGLEGEDGAEESSTSFLTKESRRDAASLTAAAPAAAAAAAAARRESGDEVAGVGSAGDPAAIESIQNLLLMVPVDLEKLRNLAWEKRGYQVWLGVGGWSVLNSLRDIYVRISP